MNPMGAQGQLPSQPGSVGTVAPRQRCAMLGAFPGLHPTLLAFADCERHSLDSDVFGPPGRG